MLPWFSPFPLVDIVIVRGSIRKDGEGLARRSESWEGQIQGYPLLFVPGKQLNTCINTLSMFSQAAAYPIGR